MTINEGTAPQDVTEEQIRQVADDVELFRRQTKGPDGRILSAKAIAAAIGYGNTVVSEFLNGKYRGNSGAVAIALQQWLIEEESRRERPETTQFVWTNVALQIKSVANYCLDYRKIGLVYGPDTAGVGKTTALRAIHQELGPRRSSLVTVDKVDANPTGLLKKICQAMHIEDRGTNKRRFDRIRDKLTGRSHLLLIDQIHNLRGATEDKPFYILTDLYDATQAAQLWCGTADLVEYLNRQRKRVGDESLAQIRRRIFPCVDLMEMLATGGSDGRGQPLVDVGQVLEMFGRNKLKLTAAAARFLASLINRPDTGGVGLCVQIVEYATMLGEMSGAKSIDVPLLQQAMRHGITSVRAELILHDLEESPLRMSKTG